MGQIVYEIGTGFSRPGYATIALWESATDIDIVASGATSGEAVILVGELIVGDTDYSEAVVITGATTDEDNYRILRPSTAAKHAGKRDTGATIFDNTGGFVACVNIQENFFKLQDIEISSDGGGVQYGVFVNSATSGVEVSGMVVYDCGWAGVSFQGSGVCMNTIVHHCSASENDASAGAFQGPFADHTIATMLHCTALASTADSSKPSTGFRYVVAHNCISMHYGGLAGHKDFLNLGAGSQNNCSSDDSADDWASPGLPDQVATDIFENVTSGTSTDLHIKAGSGPVSSGSGLSATVPTDIDGDAFHTSTPSIGADQFVGASAENVFVDDNNLVALYRYNDGPYGSGTLPVENQSQAASYTGSNTMVASGNFFLPVGSHSSPPNAPLSSGQWFGSGIRWDELFDQTDFFDLSAVSGEAGPTTTDMSGMQATSGDSLSIGSWAKVSGWDESLPATILSRATDVGGTEAFFSLEKVVVATNQVYQFTFGVGSGNDSTFVRSSPQNLSGVWQHVVGVVDSASETAKVYIDGVDATSGAQGVREKIYAPPGSGTSLDLVIPFRVGTETFDSTDLFVVDGWGGAAASGWLGETFVANRVLTAAEVTGVYSSGFIALAVDDESDTNDTLKDNIGEQSLASSEIIITAWDPTDGANPSGARHATSGFHPAFIQELGLGAVSGLNFGDLLQGTTSGTKAIVFRNNTVGSSLENMRLWQQESSALGTSGWNVAVHVDSLWLNLTLPSGSGILGKTLGEAISVLRSDLGTTISGYSIDGTLASGEEEVSQYIYLAFNADTELQPGTYGPDGFGFRLTVDNV